MKHLRPTRPPRPSAENSMFDSPLYLICGAHPPLGAKCRFSACDDQSPIVSIRWVETGDATLPSSYRGKAHLVLASASGDVCRVSPAGVPLGLLRCGGVFLFATPSMDVFRPARTWWKNDGSTFLCPTFLRSHKSTYQYDQTVVEAVNYRAK